MKAMAALAALSLIGPLASAQGLSSEDLAAGQFLVAGRGLLDPNFAKTVILLVSHDDDGAMGIIVNRPTPVKLEQMVEELQEGAERPETVWVGGPVAHWQLVLLFKSEFQPEDTESVLDGVYFSGSRVVLEDLLEGTMEFRVYAGYAGWSPGQLEHEIARGSWHILPGEPELVFDAEPESLWEELVTRGEAKWVSLPADEPLMSISRDEAAGLCAVCPQDSRRR